MYNPDKFICGGYFLVKEIARPEYCSDLLPATILTLSNCLTEIAPDDWAISGFNETDAERAEEAEKFGIVADAVPCLVRLMSEEIGLQHYNAFPSFRVAEGFYRECTNKREVALLGIGLDPSLLLSLYSRQNDDVNHGYGLFERVKLEPPLASGGEPLGFELLGFSGTRFHSWLCHNAPPEAFDKLGIRTNSAGFIDSLEDAVHVNQHLMSTGAERAIWEPWLVVRYTVGGTLV